MSTPRAPSPEVRTLARAGAIGDIHAEDVRLAAALEHLSGAGLDAILAVGDVVDGPGDPRRCVELLEAAGVEAVSGNHDRWYLERRARRDGDVVAAYLETLPATRRYETAGGPLLLCHGLGENDMRRLTPDDYGYALETNDELQELLATRSARYVINGHTHRKMVKHFAGRGSPAPATSGDQVAGVTVINAGTLLGDHDPGFALVDFTAGEVSFFEVDGGGAVRLVEIIELSIS